MPQPLAIITGAGSGIGRATAVALAATYDLVLVGRTESTLRDTRDLAGRGTIRVADVSKNSPVETLVRATIDEHGRIDALVHCAGLAPRLPLEETTSEIWQDVIDVNLSSAFYLARAVWPIFTQQKCGAIVNISSMAAKDPFSGFFAYGAAKAGLNNLGLSLAREGKSIGVRVYTIAPGAVETQMLRKIATVEQLPTGCTLSPDEVARVIVACVNGLYHEADVATIWLTR